jgi:hypothetical protein
MEFFAPNPGMAFVSENKLQQIQSWETFLLIGSHTSVDKAGI